MDSKKNYRLATDENGSPFVLNSKGSIDFGYITVTSFVEYVSANFTCIKEGHSGSYLLEVNSDRNHTLFIALAKGSEYWKVISGGVFRLKYSRNKKKVYSVPAIRMPEPVFQAKVPASGDMRQDSTEASGNSL